MRSDGNVARRNGQEWSEYDENPIRNRCDRGEFSQRWKRRNMETVYDGFEPRMNFFRVLLILSSTAVRSVRQSPAGLPSRTDVGRFDSFGGFLRN